MLRFRISASSLRCPSETAHSTQTKAPPGGGASWVFHACSIGLAVSPGGRNSGKPTTPTPSRAVGCALRGGPQKKPPRERGQVGPAPPLGGARRQTSDAKNARTVSSSSITDGYQLKIPLN